MSSELPKHPSLPDYYTVVREIAAGYMGTVWLVIDTRDRKEYAAKVFDRREVSPELVLYFRHLTQLAETLPAGSIRHALLPHETGETDTSFYQVSEFFRDATVLQDEIRNGRLAGRQIFTITAQLASALTALHELGIIHGDVKPSNILLQQQAGKLSAYLIDFGMVQPQQEGEVLIVGTHAYLHPAVRVSADDPASGSTRVQRRAIAGPYLDIYALGIILHEMLTGARELPAVLSEDVLDAELLRNVALKDRKVRRTAANLLLQMLTVHPLEPSITAAGVGAVAQLLSTTAQDERPPARPAARRRARLRAEHTSASFRLLSRLEDVAEGIDEATTPLVLAGGTVKAIASPSPQDGETIGAVNAVFANALARARVSWRVSLGMTLVVFAAIIVMVAAAVTLSITTGQSMWTLMFGGASVSLILGALVWKPYDRLFRAAVLTQQLEMIHVQTITAYRGTTILSERIEICRSAVTALSVLLRDTRDPSAFRSSYVYKRTRNRSRE